MLRLAFDFIITWRETRTRPNAYSENHILPFSLQEFQQTFILHNDAFCQTDSDRENG